jgi:large subunit ribosomal protein L21
MEKYAVIKLGGKQFIVSEGDIFTLERQDGLNIDVLLVSENGKLSVGEPFLTDIKVEAEILGEEKSRTLRVARFRAKSRHRRVYGHRQPLSRVKIISIGAGSKEGKEKSAKKEEVKIETSVEAKVAETPKETKAKKAPTKTTKTKEVKAKETSKKGSEK